jgi:dTDP-4-amino-4,6-dideoxygalactose transaminase
MYRLPEVAAAVGLAQLEKLDWFVGLREKMASLYLDAIRGCPWLQPQRVLAGNRNSYWTFSLRFLHPDVSWEEFRKKHIEFGGDGIYAAWSLLYQEDSVPDIKRFLCSIGLDGRLETHAGLCPNAEAVQPQLMQFTTNQQEGEMEKQADALRKTVAYFS